MRVLMLDKNFLVDRRIALMADSLAERGHEIKLINTEAPESFRDHSERRRRLPKPRSNLSVLSLPIDRDSNYLINPDAVGDPPPHVAGAAGTFFDSEQRKTDFKALLAAQRHSGSRMSRRLLAALMYPDVVHEMIRANPAPPLSHRLAALPLGILALPFWMMGGDGRDRRAPPQRVNGVRRLDAWERSVVRFATEIWKPDIVVANDAITLLAGAEIKARLGIPFIYDEHELYSYQPGIPHALAKTLFLEEKRLLRHVDWVILPNRQSYYIMERDMGVLNKVICTNAAKEPPGFDIRKRYDWIRDEVAIPSDHKIVLFQGGINKGRRIDFLIEGLAIARSRNVHLVFLTFGQEIPEFKALARKMGVAHRVHFLDLVPWDEIVYWAASADAGILPYQATDQNTAASSPNKLYEFITAGTPIIGSADLANVRQIVESEGFGVVRPFRKVDDYANAIDEMFDPALGGAERFRPRLIERAPTYSWEREVQAALDLYEALHEKRKPVPAKPSSEVLKHIPAYRGKR